MNKDALAEELESLRVEHRVLDSQITDIASDGAFDQIEIQRLKKRKLAIKDQILKLQSDLVPNIIA